MKKLVLVVAIMLVSWPSWATESLVQRTVVSDVLLTGTENTRVITAELILQPGAKMPRHYHHGDEFVYIVEGGTAEVPGRGEITFAAGQLIHFPREAPHGGFTVTGNSPMRAVTTHIIDKNQPFQTPVD